MVMGPVLISCLFQSCTPHKMSVLDEASNAATELKFQGQLSQGDTIAIEPVRTGVDNNNNSRAPSSRSDNSVVTPTPVPEQVKAPVVEAPAEPSLYIQNNYIGAENYKVEMTASSMVAFENLFPMSKQKDSTGQFTLRSDELWISADRSLARTNAEVCLSESYNGCSKSSEFRQVAFSMINVQTNLTYLRVENMWQTTVMKYFGDYYLTVKVQGFQRKAIIQHRAYLAVSYGARPSGTGFYASTSGQNHYGFICEQPSASEVGWMSYPYGTLANTSDSKYQSCYYRVLDNQQADDYYRKMYENMTPSISILCPATGKAGVKITCSVTSWTPYAMQGQSTWNWTVDGVSAMVGEKFVVNSPAAGTYKVQLLGQSNSGSQVKSNIVTVTISP